MGYLAKYEIALSIKSGLSLNNPNALLQASQSNPLTLPVVWQWSMFNRFL